MKSLRIVSFFALLLVLLSFLPGSALADDDPNVLGAYHSPSEPFGGETVSVYAELQSLTNVTDVRTQYCTIDPDTLETGTCFYQLMDDLGNMTFRSNITKAFSGGTMIGYKIIVEYDESLPGYFPEDHYIYYNYTGGAVITPPSEEIPFEVIVVEIVLGVLIALLVVVLVYRSVKNIKTGSNKTIMVGVVALVIVAILYGAVSLSSVGGEVTEVDDFSLNDIYGTPWNLSDHSDKVVVLDFMAITCTGCEELRESLEVAVADFTEEELEVISISVVDNDIALRQYKTDYGVEWTIARDTADLINEFGVTGLPKLVIINKDSYATFETEYSHISSDRLRSEIEDALEGTAQPISITQVSIFATGAFMGIATYFSPCSFPMLPGYISFYLSTEAERKKSFGTVLASGLISGFGIVLVFLIIGLIAISLGEAANLSAYIIYMGPIVGVILIVLGALMFTNLQYHALVRPFQNLRTKIFGEKAPGAEDKSGYYTKLFSYGVGYGAAASACTAPLFIALLLAGIVAGSFVDGLIMILIFSFTILLLMVAMTLLLSTVGQESVQKMAAHTDTIKKVSGFILVVVGAYLLFYYWTTFN